MSRKILKIQTTKKSQLLDITAQIQATLDFKEGALTVFCPHTTAGLMINEAADPTVAEDILMKLGKIVPEDADFRHLEGNSAAHIKASLIGSSVQVIVEDGRLQLGTWQGIFFAEFDGGRARQIWLMANTEQ